jgi:chromate transporter
MIPQQRGGDMAQEAIEPAAGRREAAPGVFLAFLRLGLTSFGGPVAHLGYFRAEFVARRRWLDEAAYADLVALCQFLPGPASSQVGIGLGLLRAGLPGALAAWLGFTLPSAAAMILFAYGIDAVGGIADAGWLRGLQIVAVAVVAQAVWGMARTLCPDRGRASVAVAAALLVLGVPSAFGQIGAIALGGLIGRWLLPAADAAAAAPLKVGLDRRLGAASLALFAALLAGLPLLAAATGSETVRVFGAFYRAGSLVFGGGHVVLPLLQAEVVPPGWITNDAFLAGYGAAQAVPGPLFTFAAYLGAAMNAGPGGWAGGLFCVAAIFLSSFLLVIGAMPFWNALRRRRGVQAALRGVNAAVGGLLLAALYTPVWTGAIHAPADFAVGLAAFLLLSAWAVPPWLVVLFGAAAGQLAALLA